jgi:copper oxidase (laccase) domain-containing protein
VTSGWFSFEPRPEPRHGVSGSDTSMDGRGPAAFLDAWAANAAQLRLAGVCAHRIHIAAICTSCHRDLFHSYRVDGKRAGRIVGVIRAKGVS